MIPLLRKWLQFVRIYFIMITSTCKMNSLNLVTGCVFMIFIGGIAQGRKDFDFFRQTMICKKMWPLQQYFGIYGIYIFQFLFYPSL